MKNKFMNLFLALCGVFFLLMGTFSPAAMAQEPPEMISRLPVPHDLRDLANMTVTIRDGYICVVDGEGKTVYQTDIPENSLRESDRQLLKEGIKATDMDTLLRLIEDYNS